MNLTLEKPLIEGNEVSSLIPQKFPIEMVDKLWKCTDTSSVSGLTVKEDNIFCVDGFFREPGIIENIAQTAALGLGYNCSERSKKGEKVNPPLGFIGGIKKLCIHQLPKVGSELITEVVTTHVIFDVTMIKGITHSNGEVIAECEMKIFLKKD